MKINIKLCILALSCSLLQTADVLANPTKDKATQSASCKARYLLDATSGQTLFEDNIAEPLAPASMIKIMVAYVVQKRIKEGLLDPKAVVTASAFASKIGGSQVYLKQGEQFTVSELLEAVLIQSANDAAVALAEHIAGTSDAFVILLNEEAKRLSMNDSQFHSPHGLPPGDGQLPDLVSARDFGILSRAFIKDMPELLEITKTIQKPFRNGEFMMSNHNHLLKHFPGCDGLKTGFYNKAGFGIAVTAERNGVRMIAVVMGCEQRKDRDNQAAKLLSTGLAQYASIKFLDKGAVVPVQVQIKDSALPPIAPVVKDEIRGMVRIAEKDAVTQKVSPCTNLVAPVIRDTSCGVVSYHLGEREVARSELLIPADIPKISLSGRLKKMVGL